MDSDVLDQLRLLGLLKEFHLEVERAYSAVLRLMKRFQEAVKNDNWGGAADDWMTLEADFLRITRAYNNLPPGKLPTDVETRWGNVQNSFENTKKPYAVQDEEGVTKNGVSYQSDLLYLLVFIDSPMKAIIENLRVPRSGKRGR